MLEAHEKDSPSDLFGLTKSVYPTRLSVMIHHITRQPSSCNVTVVDHEKKKGNASLREIMMKERAQAAFSLVIRPILGGKQTLRYNAILGFFFLYKKTNAKMYLCP